MTFGVVLVVLYSVPVDSRFLAWHLTATARTHLQLLRLLNSLLQVVCCCCPSCARSVNLRISQLVNALCFFFQRTHCCLQIDSFEREMLVYFVNHTSEVELKCAR